MDQLSTTKRRRLMSSDIMDVTADPGMAKKYEATTPMIAEIKYLDKNDAHPYEAHYTETVRKEIPKTIDWWQKHALCLTTHLSCEDHS